jgi:GNAT superfamily N-acetyltransferase
MNDQLHIRGTHVPKSVTIRSRTDGDADALVTVLAQVHESDQYPMMAEHVSHDWLYDAGFAAAWVAEVDGAVVGHIAVTSGYGGADFEAALGRPTAQTLGITRFFVGAVGRGSGAASALLDVVDEYANTLDMALALDVIEVNTAAIRLYEHRGWRRIGSHAADWFGPDGPHPTVFLYVR